MTCIAFLKRKASQHIAFGCGSSGIALRGRAGRSGLMELLSVGKKAAKLARASIARKLLELSGQTALLAARLYAVAR